ncbi:hypothetical protein AB0478_15560 [Streptomyces sp. NPDC051917]|uniref:hypothetical protein n=1 Tax=Streptomyces sp. NPDC051917 TaxID=3154754 RepID=UPI00344FF4D8
MLTLTTGSDGTAADDLPVSSRTTEFWAKQIKAPAGYSLSIATQHFTAAAGAPVTVVITNAKTAATTEPNPTKKPAHTASTPEEKPSSGTPGGSGNSTANSGTSDSSPSAVPVQDATDPSSRTALVGSLAHTGADACPWLLGGAGLLVAGGTAVVVTARRRARTHSVEEAPADH